jgi:predicted Fe-S protein YdhL (DUF1289 family)
MAYCSQCARHEKEIAKLTAERDALQAQITAAMAFSLEMMSEERRKQKHRK